MSNREYKAIIKKMGGYIFLYYEKDKPLFYDTKLIPSDIFRIIYLSSFMDYKNELMVKEKRNKSGVLKLEGGNK